MANWKPHARATTTVSFGPDGDPKGIVAGVDSYEADDDWDEENQPDHEEFRGGASAKLHFSVEGTTAVLDGIKDPSSPSYGTRTSKWDFGPSIVRTFPIAQRAVEKLPFVQAVELVNETVEDELAVGWEAEFE